MDINPDITELQKYKVNRKKINNKFKNNEVIEKSSFGKQFAKKERKADSKRIVNKFLSGDYDDYDDYDDDTFELISKFNNR